MRGSHSTGFRAPTVGQANVINTQTSIINRVLTQSGTFPPTTPLSAFYGGKELTPEESVSYAAGIVYSNGDFFMTADYYNIEVTDRITQTSPFDVEPDDYAALEALGVVSPSQYGTLTYFANNFDTKTQGLDVVANYGMDLFGGETQFSFAYNYNSTEVSKRKPTIDPKTDLPLVDEDNNIILATNDFKVKRLEEGIPKHRATFTVAQSWDSMSMFIRANYFGKYFAVHADGDDEDSIDDAGSAMTLDAEMSYFYNDSLTFSVGANNLLDQEAEKIHADDIWSGAIYYESGPFDNNGGFYYVKATYNF